MNTQFKILANTKYCITTKHQKQFSHHFFAINKDTSNLISGMYAGAAIYQNTLNQGILKVTTQDSRLYRFRKFNSISEMSFLPANHDLNGSN